ncbi:hypothetical protein GCM10027598_22860 [Amycolatopsis oliviviridis]|uniref:DUF676 domain-containing protein n=1 Tax=Amycolatopsis oliviviridis TaxID=1471590 RepID=A0ABQ3LH07_9PSEU|nr:hypothetical protein [Amycolatopsis oliviviridis]GHH15702.1 hypothetical protein GCM10017790_30500 [Amycolatopsis oliviviridis]
MTDLVEVCVGEDPVVDVVFVHGLDGDARESWSAGTSDSFWPEWLAEEVGGLAVWSLGYDAASSGWLGHAMPIQDRAINLLARLENDGIGQRPLCFVTHSMGGLVVKEMLLHAAESRSGYAEFATATRGVVFLATPHTGSDVATKAIVKALGVVFRRTVAVGALERNSAHLRQLNTRYRNWATDPQVRIGHKIFYETRSTRGVHVVDAGSADPGIPGQTPIPVDANHIEICKPVERNDLVYGQIKRFVAGIAEAVKAGGTAPPGPGPPEDSGYWHQVTQIAPAELSEREEELAALTEFCTAEEVDVPYRWWRGEAWTGKSALMSWFVLHPPEDVRIVSFFVTARLQGHNDRAGFVENVVEQLEALLGADRRDLTENTRESYLLKLLADAASRCEAVGKRLVLLVDGLDEDSGVTTDPDARSIAALLPSRPPSGTRVIVTGRPNPLAPLDVPSSHPLRDDTIVRRLSPSRAARDVRREMEQELRRLLKGEPRDRDLLGLLTVAGSGLTADELAGLIGSTAQDVEYRLGTRTGRSFVRRDDMYVLGHDDLRTTALAIHSTQELDRHRDRIHRWIDRHREQGWPDAPSRFLLRGYLAMLVDRKDRARSLSLTTDPTRHQWLLAQTGDDVHALREIKTALALYVADEPSDLAAIGTLAFFRDELETHVKRPLTGLPTILVLLGQPGRAKSLAEVAENTTWAWDRLIARVAETGDIDTAVAWLSQVPEEPWGNSHRVAKMAIVTAMTVAHRDAEARELADRTAWPWGTIALARGHAETRRTEEALRLLDSVTEGLQPDHAVAVVKLLVRLGDVGRIEALVARADTNELKARLLAAAAAGLMPTDREQAEPMLGRAEDFLATGPRPEKDADTVTDLCLARIAMDDYESALRDIRSANAPGPREWVFVRLAMRLTAVGRWEDALRVARSFRDPYATVKALAAVFRCLDPVPDEPRIRQLITEAEVVATSYHREHDLLNATVSIRAGSLLEGARILVTAEPFDVATGAPSEQAVRQARVWTAQAEQIHRTKDNLQERAYALGDLAMALVTAESEKSLTRRTIALARKHLDELAPRLGATAMGQLALAAAEFGDHDTAVKLTETAIARIEERNDRYSSYYYCMAAFTVSKAWDKAQSLAESFAGRPGYHFAEKRTFTDAWLAAGKELSAVSSFVSVRDLVVMLVKSGRIEEGETLIVSLPAGARLGAQARMARELAVLGEQEALNRVLASMDDSGSADLAAQKLDTVLDGMVAYAVAGRADDAERRLRAAADQCHSLSGFRQPDAYLAVVRALCELPKSVQGSVTGHLSTLVTTIRSLKIRGIESRAAYLTRLVSVLTRGGQDLLATHVAAEISESWSDGGKQPAEHLRLASALGDGPVHDKLACEQLAGAWKNDSWSLPLREVARRRPEVVETLAKLVLSHWDQPIKGIA